MGLVISYFIGPTEADEIDPATGLSASQRNIVKKCWSQLQPANIREIGVEIMITFFRMYPEHQNEFEKFRGRELSELADDPRFHAHCINIMSTFEQAIEFLHDAELCAAGLHMAGERHARRGQQIKPFEDLEPIVKDVLLKHLNVTGPTETARALDIAVSLIFKVLKDAVQEYHENQMKSSTQTTS